MEYETFVLSKTRKDVLAAVVNGTLRVHNYIGPIIGLGKSLLNNNTGPFKLSLKLLHIYKLVPLKTVLSFGTFIAILLSLRIILNFCILVQPLSLFETLVSKGYFKCLYIYIHVPVPYKSV